MDVLLWGEEEEEDPLRPLVLYVEGAEEVVAFDR